MLRMSIIDGRVVSKSPVSSDVVCMAGSVFVLVRLIFFYIC